jgi:hypothetical protein
LFLTIPSQNDYRTLKIVTKRLSIEKTITRTLVMSSRFPNIVSLEGAQHPSSGTGGFAIFDD